MESIKTLWSLLPWIALIIVGVWHMFRQAKIVELREDILDLLNEIDIVFKSHKQERTRLLEEIEDWKRKAVTPLEDFPTPVVFERAEVKHWVAKTELEQEWGTDKIRPGQVERATQEFLNSIRPFIYSELVRENGRAVYYQGIFILKPNKLHYEKQS